MKILAHRGCWNTEIKSNSPQAIRSALERGFGFESDLRDYSGKLVISHDMNYAKKPKKYFSGWKNSMISTALLSILRQMG